ncbi:hypothetical protein TorRG33x02_335790 [Trema orientale]|uniref:Uncharacterized protein n=1 Tax=Trema orientale TaxID=63057 RepID=A0A2P5B114_TREOI|nr:hypothetical protein TorRG33x02_335790 [Trema orientale]
MFNYSLNLSQDWYMVSLSFWANVGICLLRLLILWCRKYLLKKVYVISAHVPMDLGPKKYSQLFALSFRENGKNFNPAASTALGRLWKVAVTSSNSLMCTYGFSLSKP